MKIDAGIILTFAVVAVAGAGLYWRQIQAPEPPQFPASAYSQPYRPDFPEPKAAEEQKKKDKQEFARALKLSEKTNPYAAVPEEKKSKPKSKGSPPTANNREAGDHQAESPAPKKSADDSGVFLTPKMDSVSLPTTSPATETIAVGATIKPETKAATTATNVFAAGTGKPPASASGSSKSPSQRGPDIPELGATRPTPTPPAATQVATTEGSKATATPTPDPRIPPSTFNPSGGRLPANSGGQTLPAGSTRNPNSPPGVK